MLSFSLGLLSFISVLNLLFELNLAIQSISGSFVCCQAALIEKLVPTSWQLDNDLIAILVAACSQFGRYAFDLLFQSLDCFGCLS